MFRIIRSALEGVLWLIQWKGLRYEITELKQRIADMERLTCQISWEPEDLRIFEKKIYSQNGEDGIIQEIFHRIGYSNRFFVEFGVQDGLECNCRRLATEEGWHGLFMEMDGKDFGRLSSNYSNFSTICCAQQIVTSSNIEELLENNDVPKELDLLSIDIDGNDYWVWAAIQCWHPRVVVIEYNAHFRPPVRWVMKENDSFQWRGTTYFGASLMSLYSLGMEKGYRLVTTDSRGVNAFFVRKDLTTSDKFILRTVSYHYSPPLYGPHGLGHPADLSCGEYLKI